MVAVSLVIGLFLTFAVCCLDSLISSFSNNEAANGVLLLGGKEANCNHNVDDIEHDIDDIADSFGGDCVEQ